MTHNSMFSCPEHPAVEAVELAYMQLEAAMKEGQKADKNLIEAKKKPGYSISSPEAQQAFESWQILVAAQGKMLLALQQIKQAINQHEFANAHDRLKAAVGNHMICAPEIFAHSIALVHTLSYAVLYPVYTGTMVK